MDQLADVGLDAVAKRDEFQRRVGEENRLLAAARRAYLDGVEAGQRSVDDRFVYRFLAADLARRLGQFDVAEQELKRLALDKRLPKEVNGLVVDVQAVLGVQARSAVPAGN